MSIRKDKASGVYHIDVRAPGGSRIRCSARTTEKRAAQEYHDKLKADLWRQSMLGEEPDHFFEEAAAQFLRLCEDQRDYESKERHIAYWRTQFSGRTVRSLKSGEIISTLPTHTTHKHRSPTPLKPASKNRYLATMRRLLKLCEEWEWITKCPKFAMFEEPPDRVRWEPQLVIAKLLNFMQLQWMRDVSIVAVATGMREDELLSLRPQNVDLTQRNAWVVAEEAKSGYARPVPLNDDAMEVLRRRIPKAVTYVFERKPRDGGKPRRITQIDSPHFKRACEKVGIVDFHFHDLRHTWASWHAQAGTPLKVLQELGGWETLEMVLKYAHLSQSHLADHAKAVKIWSSSTEEEKTPLIQAA